MEEGIFGQDGGKKPFGQPQYGDGMEGNATRIVQVGDEQGIAGGVSFVAAGFDGSIQLFKKAPVSDAFVYNARFFRPQQAPEDGLKFVEGVDIALYQVWLRGACLLDDAQAFRCGG